MDIIKLFYVRRGSSMDGRVQYKQLPFCLTIPLKWRIHLLNEDRSNDSLVWVMRMSTWYYMAHGHWPNSTRSYPARSYPGPLTQCKILRCCPQSRARSCASANSTLPNSALRPVHMLPTVHNPILLCADPMRYWTYRIPNLSDTALRSRAGQSYFKKKRRAMKR